MELHERITARQAELKNIRLTHENPWQDIVDLFMPFRGDVTTKLSEGMRRMPAVLDSTGMEAADMFANFIMGNLFGPDWLRIQVGSDVTQSDLDLLRAGEITALRVLDELSNDNFFPNAFEFIRDMGTLGTGVMRVEELDPVPANEFGSTFGGLSFKAIPIWDAWFSEGRNGFVDTVHWKFEISARRAIEKFGRTGPMSVVAEKVNAGKHEEKIEFLHAVFPNKEPFKVEGSGKFAGVTMLLTERDSLVQSPIVEQETFDVFPYIVGRWMQVNREVYGRGAGHKARPPMRGLNQLMGYLLQAVAIDVLKPLMQENDSVMNLNIIPGGAMTLKRASQFTPQPLDMKPNYQGAEFIIEKDREDVKKAFLADILEEPATEPRSAEETRARRQRALQRLSAPAGRMEREFLGPLVGMVIEIMEQAGALPELSEVRAQGNVRLETTFVSPLIVAQREVSLQPTLQTINDTLALAQGGMPEIVDTINPDGVAAAMRRSRTPSTLIYRSQEEIEQIRAQRAQQIEEQRQAELAESVGRTAKSVEGLNAA